MNAQGNALINLDNLIWECNGHNVNFKREFESSLTVDALQTVRDNYEGMINTILANANEIDPPNRKLRKDRDWLNEKFQMTIQQFEMKIKTLQAEKQANLLFEQNQQQLQIHDDQYLSQERFTIKVEQLKNDIQLFKKEHDECRETIEMKLGQIKTELERIEKKTKDFTRNS
uniref:Uncharacterized protein n=1 Tax=Panagrolaimus sp. ES5 TaxID=591445 RepID=A0AC34GG36_9BILA